MTEQEDDSEASADLDLIKPIELIFRLSLHGSRAEYVAARAA